MRTLTKLIHLSLLVLLAGCVPSLHIAVKRVKPGEVAWPPVAALFPRAVGWMNDPKDGSQLPPAESGADKPRA